MHPVLVEIGGWTLHTYGLTTAFAWVFALALALVRGHRKGEDPWFVFEMLIGLIISGVGGSRLLFVALNLDLYRGRWMRVFDLHDGGLVYLGGFFLAAAFVHNHAKRLGRDPWEVLDLLSPSLALALAIGRIGCFSAGCCYGQEAPGLPWAVVFTHPLSIAPRGVALHPSQLYLLAGNLALCLWLIRLEVRKRFTGHVFAHYLMLYAALRVLVEFTRGDAARGFLVELSLWGNEAPELFSTSQALSAVMLAMGLVLMRVRQRSVA